MNGSCYITFNRYILNVHTLLPLLIVFIHKIFCLVIGYIHFKIGYASRKAKKKVCIFGSGLNARLNSIIYL